MYTAPGGQHLIYTASGGQHSMYTASGGQHPVPSLTSLQHEQIYLKSSLISTVVKTSTQFWKEFKCQFFWFGVGGGKK